MTVISKNANNKPIKESAFNPLSHNKTKSLNAIPANSPKSEPVKHNSTYKINKFLSKAVAPKTDSVLNNKELIAPPLVLPADTPDTEKPEMQYDFNDNSGRPPQYDPNSKLYLSNPSNIKTETNYNAQSGQYDVNQKIGDMQYRPNTYMSMKEYRDYMFKKQMREYWRSRVAADDINNKPRKGLIPPIKIESEIFDRIFGGNTVDIKPTGTAELIFGLNRTINLNPAIPQRQQKITNFDFNMRIQLNLIGKIGDKLKVTTNYNTEASFDWENKIKLDYTGYEDDIIKKIEAGNISLPLNSTLISGSQTLFGFKTQMQFGKLMATAIFSQQRGKKTEINVQGGAQTQNFVITADNYEANKHFFLSQYFRDNYDKWMGTIPVVNTPIVITRVEAYILNINGNAEQARPVLAFQDLGERLYHVSTTMTSSITPINFAIVDSLTIPDSIPRNGANNLYSIISQSIASSRNIVTSTQNLLGGSFASNANYASGGYMSMASDFNSMANARKLNASEFTFNPRMGYISLNQQLTNDQTLAVSYQFTYNGKTYQVGEFSDQITNNTSLLICKLLKNSVVSVYQPVWRLMMKNVYATGGYNLNPQNFQLNVFYNNIETGVDVPYLPFGAVNGIQLIRVLNADRISVNGDRGSDGVYDFINNYTINQTTGRVYLPTVEPFGRSLAAKFSLNDFPEANKYIFTELYDSTKTAATFIQSKNRYKLKGSYTGASGSDISLNALNIPQGSVLVSANGVPLVENSDYTVDYTLGRVKIINEGILNSGAQIKVSLESNSLFNVQQKSLMGTRLDYKVDRNLSLGSTLLRYAERPLTQKVSFGDEPVSNLVIGTDFNYSADAPFLTRLVDKLPFYSTKTMSTIKARGEFAKLFPGNASAINTNGGNSYIDDFEGSISLIDIRSPNGWFLSGVPQGLPNLFPEGAITNSITSGLNRARLNWYTVDPIFTRNQGSGSTPNNYNNNIFSNNMWRQVFETELFPGKTPPNGQQVVLPVLDLGFYPSQRGPYNYDVNPVAGISSGIDVNGNLLNPQRRWGGIMRRLETNDFQAANIEYIQFWLMDPYNVDYNQTTNSNFDPTQLPSGDIYFNIGNISEDVLRDGQMSYENGLRGQSQYSSNLPVDTTNLAIVPLIPPTVNAFSQDNGDRTYQDVGYDGMNNTQENAKFSSVINALTSGGFNMSAPAIASFLTDPSSDDYHFFRGDDYDGNNLLTIDRYAKYNNPEGNSPTPSQYQSQNAAGYPTASSTIPNIEDVNRDNTLNEIENYYQYHVKISPSQVNPSNIGQNFLVNAFDGTAQFGGISKTVKWYQFKIPITQFETVVGDIQGFNSIRFMRVYMTGFNRPVLLRLARFELVRSDWRTYEFDLRQPGEYIAIDDNTTTIDVSAVNLQENGTKKPINYVMPPGIQQQQNVQTTNLVLMNEQSLQLRVNNLKNGDSRAIFKNVDLDTRMYNNIKMNVHAEKLNNQNLNNGDLVLFFRVGTDYNNNYYEYSVPLQLTSPGTYDPNSNDSRYQVWPAKNEINFKFSDITNLKNSRNTTYGYFSNLNNFTQPYTMSLNGYSLTVQGNPNLGTIKSIMVGVRNPKTPDGLAHSVEVWIDELRLTDFNNKGGWAATGQVQANLADLAVVNLAGTYSTPFWGGVEKKINDRSKETNATWDVVTSINAGKFFPASLKINLPIYWNFGRTKITPLFNPIDPDVRTTDFENNPEISQAKKTEILNQVIDFTERRGFNISNFKIEGLKKKGSKPMPWDLNNIGITLAYNEIFKRNVNIEFNSIRSYKGNIIYSYVFATPYAIKPFKNAKLFDNKWGAIIKDFNLQLMPNSFGASMNLNRQFTDLKNRDITSFYAGAVDFTNPILINKNFIITRNYNMRWDFSKAVKWTFQATNQGRVLEPIGYTGVEQKHNRDSLLQNLMKGGTNTNYNQSNMIDVNLPLNKFPLLEFVTANYKYTGTFTWTRRPFAAADSIGNTIQNTHTHNFTGNFNMTQLYNKIPYFNRIMSGQNKKPDRNMQNAIGLKKSDAKKSKDTLNDKTNNFDDILEFIAKGIMMVKTVNITYQLQGGQGLPNFKPNSQFMGMDFTRGEAPGVLFASGFYDKAIVQRSISNDWLSHVPNQTTPYTEVYTKNLSFRSSIEPHTSLKIDITGNYTQSKNLSEYIMFDPTTNTFSTNVSRNETGNFSMSAFNYFRSFSDAGTGVNSTLFSDFLTERQNVARQLSASNSKFSQGYQNIPNNGYYDGYSPNQQDVLYGAFYNTYMGRSIKNYSTTNLFPSLPMPNWNVSWDGLGRLKITKKYFKNIIIRHGYRSTYNVAGYSNNILYNQDGVTQDQRMPVTQNTGTVAMNPNFVPYYNITAVTLQESFAPLIKFDFQFNKPGWTLNVETKRDKTTSLNITGPQIIETKGQEYIVGLGYMYPKLKIKGLKIMGKPLESNLNVKIDFSYRQNISVIRRISDGISVPTGGTNIFTLRSAADYILTPNITLRVFYDLIRNYPQTSVSFPTGSAMGGFSLRITFQ